MSYGKFDILFKNQHDKFELQATASLGDILGETSLLTEDKHSARVIANLDSEVLMVKKTQFFKILNKFPQLAINLSRIEANRLKERFSHNNPLKTSNNSAITLHTYFGMRQHASAIALNILASMALITPKQKSLYVEILDEDSTSISKKHINAITKINEKLPTYKKYSIEQLTIPYFNNMYILPITNIKKATFLYQETNLAKFLSFLHHHFSYVFIHINSHYIKEKLFTSLSNQVNQIIIGVSSHFSSISKMRSNIKFIQNHYQDPDAPGEIKYYLQQIDTKLTKQNINISRQTNKKYSFNEKNSLRAFTKAHEKINMICSLPDVENYLQIQFDFKIRGFIDSLDQLLHKNSPFIRQNKTSELRKSFLSIARYLSNQTLGIAFGGGGARSLVAIGVTHVFEQHNIKPDYIAGTSMGAVIGALVAMGKTAQEINKIFKEDIHSDRAILSYTIPLFSFFQEKKANLLLKKYFEHIYIEDLHIPFSCVATDLLTGKEHRFNRGPLWVALRASISLPVVFPPVHWSGHFLIDGAAVNNVPGNILVEQGITHTIGIIPASSFDSKLSHTLSGLKYILKDLSSEKRTMTNLKDKVKFILRNIRRPLILAIANKAILIEGATLMQYLQEYFKYTVIFELGDFSIFDLSKREQLIKVGINITESHMKKIKDQFLLKQSHP